jgi:hypothetical protein
VGGWGAWGRGRLGPNDVGKHFADQVGDSADCADWAVWQCQWHGGDQQFWVLYVLYCDRRRVLRQLLVSSFRRLRLCLSGFQLPASGMSACGYVSACAADSSHWNLAFQSTAVGPTFCASSMTLRYLLDTQATYSCSGCGANPASWAGYQWSFAALVGTNLYVHPFTPARRRYRSGDECTYSSVGVVPVGSNTATLSNANVATQLAVQSSAPINTTIVLRTAPSGTYVACKRAHTLVTSSHVHTYLLGGLARSAQDDAHPHVQWRHDGHAQLQRATWLGHARHGLF